MSISDGRHGARAEFSSLLGLQLPDDSGWGRLLSGPSPFAGDGAHPMRAYSEFMPSPFVGVKPAGALDPSAFDARDPDGFQISEDQQVHQLRPGLTSIARHFRGLHDLLLTGQHLFPRAMLEGNPYYPPSLLERAAGLGHERFLLILSLALSRTLDDKGRVRWTLFGSSQEGPARPFWKSFERGPGRPRPESECLAIMQGLLGRSHSLSFFSFGELRAAGLRVLPMGHDPQFPEWGREELPAWAEALVLGEAEPLDEVRYLLTFRPFSSLPAAIVERYYAGRIHLLPFPGSLVFFGHQGYRKLARELPTAMQIPLLHLFPGRQAAPSGMRVPQSGWLDEPRAHGQGQEAGAGGVEGAAHHGLVVGTVRRTHRWNRSLRDEDETQVAGALDRVTSVLFSNDPDRLGLYGKPMAKNAQVWTSQYHLLLDGPRHGRHRLDDAAHVVGAGGHFGYRFAFPPMRVGLREVSWQLPLCLLAGDEVTEIFTLPEGPLGYLTARGPGEERGPAPVELWPRLLCRSPQLAAAELYERDPGHRRHQTSHNARKLLEAHEHLGGQRSDAGDGSDGLHGLEHGGRLRRSYARSLLTAPRGSTLDDWLSHAARAASEPVRGAALASHLRSLVEPHDTAPAVDSSTGIPTSITFAHTATRAFEERYYGQVARLAEGEWVAKDNADYAGHGAPVQRAAHDLEHLGDYLHAEYRALIEKHHMKGRACVADHRFRWRTDFDFPWMGGWARNQTGHASERNIVMIIPGIERGEAVIMGDHYDTAYMEDVYEEARGGDLTRRSAAGADDNHSATSALLMAADLLLPLSRAGKLKRDVWLVHLTGEEFPADCLGARALVERIVEGSFGVAVDPRHDAGHGAWMNLAQVRICGAFILDMVAHNNDHDRYVFQISHGEGAGSARLSALAHDANERWNHAVPIWNRSADRRHPGPSLRMPDGSRPPPVVAHARVDGEIRPAWHPRSSLYNTDAQIFSDAGIPVLLFMENYDINRVGYHDTHDTMANIDLDYAAAVVAIAIETVAQAATAEAL